MVARRFLTPSERFISDPRQLRLFDCDEALRRKFVLHEERRVSPDRIVDVGGTPHEVPRGVPVRQRAVVYHSLLDEKLWVLHKGELVLIKPVDLAANARARRSNAEQPEPPRSPLPKSAADLAYERDLKPVIGLDGGCSALGLDGTTEDAWT